MDKVNFFFSGWEPLLRIFVVGTLAFIVLVALLRVTGKRSLAQMSGFDFVITVALGSTFGRLITAKGVSLAESAAAFLLLIFLQYTFAYMGMKFGWFSRMIKTHPTLLFYRGEFLEDSIRRCRVSKNEILSVIRQQGIESLDDVEAVVLEISGGWSVVKKGSGMVEIEKSTLKPLKEAEGLKKIEANG